MLTSYHVVPGLEPAAVDVRPLSDREEAPWLPARLCWTEQPVDLDAHPERDAALLVIDARHRRAGTVQGRVRFGLVTGQDRTPCVGLGFPLMSVSLTDRSAQRWLRLVEIAKEFLAAPFDGPAQRASPADETARRALADAANKPAASCPECARSVPAAG
ncbi:hypothetical protein AB0N62_34720 [Streptomyces sp. NPDC093982]|uniref:hypothetical protein n=1 Tax=Streptomyces sp. NPDC093982 TaxID=3155077 RepID=UPI003437DF2B